MRIEVFGDPVDMPRHKVTIKGQHPHAYIDGKHKIHAWKALIQDKVSTAIDNNGGIPYLLSDSVSVDLVFTFPRPKSLPKKVTHHIKKPDVDNLAKAVLDALNGIIYRDDSQVNKLSVSKLYGSDTGVIIEIGG